MQQWEYKSVTVYHGWKEGGMFGRNKWSLRIDEYYSEHDSLQERDTALSAALDMFGKDGWELGGVAGSSGNDYRLFFKRPKQ